MIRLTTLGALDLRSGDGTEANSVLRQPKRFALLAYLVLARPHGFQRRDRVLAMFWPELDRERARHSLNQAVFYLRRSLGRNIVLNRGDEEIGIGPDVLWCDALAFDDAIDGGRLEDALALYQGEVLAGFHVADAPDFERFLDEERTQRAQRAAEAAWTLAERAGSAHDVASARGWAARANALIPWDERGLRRYMTLLDHAGDRAGAIAAFHDFAHRLRTDLEVEPSAETLELVENIKVRAEPNGGPEPAPILGSDATRHAELEPESTERRSPSVTPAPPLTFASWARLAIAEVRWSAVLVVLFFAAIVQFLGARPDPLMRVAVLPVRDESPNAQYGHITNALTSTIIHLMHHPGSLHVVSEFGVRPYKDAAPTHEEVARRLDVAYIVNGVLTGSDERIKVTIELIETETGELKERRVIEKAGTDWLAFSESVGAELATVLRSRLGKEFREGEWKAATRSEKAWEAVARADELLRLARASEVVPEFTRSLDLLAEADSQARLARREDAKWSEPLAMLARTTERRALYAAHQPGFTLEHGAALFDTAEAYAEKALDMSGRSVAALELRGTVRHRRFVIAPPPGNAADSLLKAAEADLEAALDLDRTRARAASTLSYVLFAQGRLDEAADYGRRAYDYDAYLEEMDNIANHMFTVTFHQGHDDEAAEWCDRVGRRMPGKVPSAFCSLMLLSWNRDASGKIALFEAERAGEGEEAGKREMYRPCVLALVVPAVEREFGGDSARSLLERARSSVPPALSICPDYEIGALIALGETDEARKKLAALLARQPSSAPRLLANRFFAPLFEDGPEWLTSAGR